VRRLIFISGSFNPALEAAMQSSPVPVLRKPFALSDIRQVIRQALEPA
jgi:hypothetical protein